MDKQVIKNLLYGSILETIKDTKYYYHSPFGGKYSKFSLEGEKAILEIMTIYAEKILEEEARLSDKRAKELVIKGLKGEEV